MVDTPPVESVVNFNDLVKMLKGNYDHDKTWRNVCISLYQYIAGFELSPEASRSMFVVLFYGNLPVKVGMEVLNKLIFTSPEHLNLEASERGAIRKSILNEFYEYVRHMLPSINVEHFLFYLLVVVAVNHYHKGLNRRHKQAFVLLADRANTARNYMTKDAAERLEKLISNDRKLFRARNNRS